MPSAAFMTVISVSASGTKPETSRRVTAPHHSISLSEHSSTPCTARKPCARAPKLKLRPRARHQPSKTAAAIANRYPTSGSGSAVATRMDTAIGPVPHVKTTSAKSKMGFMGDGGTGQAA